jgi:undecaprenyl pyrophosphate phosphatase UppP
MRNKICLWIGRIYARYTNKCASTNKGFWKLCGFHSIDVACLVLVFIGTSLQDAILKYIFVSLGLLFFIALIVVGCILIITRSDIFLFKEEKRVFVEHRYYKDIGKEVKEMGDTLSPPKKITEKGGN